MRTQEFFVRGGGGGAVQAPQLILQFTEGLQWFYYTFRGGSNFFQGGGGPNANFYRNPLNHKKLVIFQGRGGSGLGPPIPPLNPHMDNVAFGTNRLRRVCEASFEAYKLQKLISQ